MEPFENYRPLLFSIAYRMLGSAMEAEDMVQETYLRYSAVPPESVQSLKPFLATITTRLCLDQLKSAREKRETYIGPWLPEPLRTDTTASQVGDMESLSVAFLVLLENLSPAERAVFLLREVFDYDYGEIAEMLEKDEAACRQLFSRAKRHITEHRPRYKSSREEHERIMGSFMQAVGEGEIDGFTHLLAEDVVWTSDGGGKVTATTRPVVGREKVAALYKGLQRKAAADIVYEIADINGRPAIIIRQNSVIFGVMTLEIGEGKIQAIHYVANPDKLERLS